MRERVLFVCEHGSAKSVIAAAHYERIARARGMDAHAISRGTDPDAEYPPHVLAGLASEGLEPLDNAPAKLMADDLGAATQIIAFCSPDTFPTNTGVTEVWGDVPAVSSGYAEARDEIVRRVERLFGS